MKIQDKLIADKKSIVKDIDEAIAKMDEYVSLIDALAKKVELAKTTLENIYDELEYQDNKFTKDIERTAFDALQKLNDE
jgi:hypothetical protein